LICGGLWEKVHLLGLLWVYEVVGFPFCLYRRCFPAFSLAKRKGFGQKRSFRWMRRAFEARPHEGIGTTAFAALAKGLCAVKGAVCDRSATVRARTGFATPHSGARRKWNGIPVCVAPARVVFRLICGESRGNSSLRPLLKFDCSWWKAHSSLFRLFFPAKEKSTKEAPFPHPALLGAGMHSAKRLTAFAKLAKGRCVITQVSARGAYRLLTSRARSRP